MKKKNIESRLNLLNNRLDYLKKRKAYISNLRETLRTNYEQSVREESKGDKTRERDGLGITERKFKSLTSSMNQLDKQILLLEGGKVTKELNELVQRQNSRVTANTEAEKKLKKVPIKGTKGGPLSDLRGDLRIKQDEKRSKIVPLDELDQYSNVQDTSGYSETEALLTPMYDADNDPFKGMRTGEEETTPTMADFTTYDNDTSSNKAQTNNTSSRSNLNIGPRAVGPAGISDRNVPKGYIRTEGKLQSVKSVKGQRAKLRLDRLRKLQARIKAGK